MPEMDAPRALVFRPLVKGNEALGTRLQKKGQGGSPRSPPRSATGVPFVKRVIAFICCYDAVPMPTVMHA